MKNFQFSISNFQLALIAAIATTLLFTSCRKDEYETPYMTLITSSTDYVRFFLAGSGEAIIYWGDETQTETSLSIFSLEYNHCYSIPPPIS